MVRPECCDVGWPVLSVAFMVKVKVPAPVGMPASRLLMPAGAPTECGARPGGSCPEATAAPPLRKR